MRTDARLTSRYGTALAALAVVAALLYGTRLDEVPLHLHHDEILVGLLGHSVAESGRDPNGRLLPAYFQVGASIHWYPPIVVYMTALFLKVLPFSDTAVRLPNAFVGVVSVILMFFVARRMFRRDDLALLAAAMLTVTPAHFLHSRIATDSLYPVAFILTWLLGLLRYLEQPGAGRIILTTSVLGFGTYSYVASVVMMPIYLAMTLAVLLWERASVRTLGLAVAGFGWPLIFGVVFLILHPEIVGHLLAKYSLARDGAHLNPLQQIKEAFTYWNVSDRLNFLHNAFAPGYLFVTGGSNVAHSTRQAGVFLAPLAVFLVAGIYDAVTRPTRPKAIALAGFLTAPVAAAIVLEDYAIPRMLGLLPFGVLLATAGVARMWQAPLARSPLPLSIPIGLVLLITGAGYATATLVRQGRISGSALLLIAAGSLVMLVGRECHRRRSWTPVAATLVILMPIQFYLFHQDYFGGYPARSAGRYGYNARAAIEQMIALHDRGGGVPLYLNEEIPYVKAYWEFYLTVHHRTELISRATNFDTRSDILGDIRPGSLLLTDASDRALDALGGRRDFVRVGSATDPVDAGAPPNEATRTTFIIYQKR